MKPYALIDLHCDTLTDCKYSSGLGTDTLDDPQRVLSLSSIPEGVHWAQFYAIFIPDECRGEDAIRYYEANRDNFIRQMDKFSDRVKRCRTCADMEEAFQSNRTAAFLSVENGSAPVGADVPIGPSSHDEQISLGDLGGQTVLNKLRMTDVNILSPIEALNLLAELKQDLAQ